MKKMMCVKNAVTLSVLGVVASASNALAIDPLADVSLFSVDTASIGTVGGVIITGLAGMWGLRKLVKTINRS